MKNPSITTVPIFPLPNLVFFPNTLVPLHIFEPRYKEMVKDALSGERLIGIVLLKPGWEKDYYGNPPIFEVGCVGSIVSEEPLEDGRFNLVLLGIGRIKVLQIVKDHPYRSARVDMMGDVDTASHDEKAIKEHLVELISRWNETFSKEQYESYRIRVDEKLPLGALTNVAAALLKLGIYEKQKLLEELSPLKRAEKIISTLKAVLDITSITSKRKVQISSKSSLN